MNKISISLLVVVIIFLTAGCSHSKKINPEALKLNNEAVQLFMDSVGMDSGRPLKKAINLLNQAIKIDSNYLIAYRNKFDYQIALKQLDSAIATGKQLIRLAPQDGTIRLRVGMAIERAGDTVRSVKYYKDALALLNKRLDTMNVRNKNYEFTQESKGAALILLNQPEKGHKILQDLYNSSEPKERERLQMAMNMNRHEIIYGKTIVDTVKYDTGTKSH
jgi:tetratricopeptide (TPR) repeat protein